MRARARPWQPFGLWWGTRPDRSKLSHDLLSDLGVYGLVRPAPLARGPRGGRTLLVITPMTWEKHTRGWSEGRQPYFSPSTEIVAISSKFAA
jgi:hypothetical protein